MGKIHKIKIVKFDLKKLVNPNFSYFNEKEFGFRVK